MKISAFILGIIILQHTVCLYAQQSLTVQVKETRLRSSPSQWSSSVATLKYGDSVNVVSSQKDWVEGEASTKKKGFVHISAMSTKKVILSGKSAPDSGIDTTDVILAGKGFSKATEDEYVKANSGSDFKSVNAVEAVKLSDAEIKSFMREGKIGEGAQKNG